VATRDVLPPSETELIEAFTSHLRLERRLSDHTVAAYRRDLGQLALFLHRNDSQLLSATRQVLRRFLALQHTLGYARASIARRVGAIHTFYRWALADARSSANVATIGFVAGAVLVAGGVVLVLLSPSRGSSSARRIEAAPALAQHEAGLVLRGLW
jgi:hypothetical protein